MAIEAIKGAGMSFQGSSSTAAVKAETTAKVESASNETTSNQIAQETITISTKEASADGSGSGNEGTYNPQLQLSNQNAQIKKAVEEINKKAYNSEAVFGIHDATNRVTIKIIDKETKEVLKEYPPEKTLDMIAKVWEMAGLMVDEKR